jgi:hypothetical protein
VRIQACSFCHKIVSRFKVIAPVLSFQESPKYSKRQDFVTICEGLIQHDFALFQRHFIDKFCALASDPCVNVRIELSLCIERTSNQLLIDPRIGETVQRLQVDSCRDVKGPVKAIEINTQQMDTGLDVDLFVRGWLD